MDLDINTSLVKNDTITYARNATMFSQQGDLIFYQTEMGNKLVTNIPFPCIGHERLPDGTFILFLTDNVSSEIGIFNEFDFSYTKKLNASWLNFDKSNLVTAKSKENFDGTFNIYWADGRRNPDRVLNLSLILEATEENTRMTKLITPPQVDINKSTAGVLPNGSYQVGLFHSIAGQKIGEFYSVTLPISIYNENNNSGAIEIDVSNFDGDFIEYQLVVIQTTLNTTTAKIVGTFPSSTSKIHISNFNSPEYISIPIGELVISNTPWIASDQIDGNNQLLFRVGVETIPEPNYQEKALEIDSEYVLYQVPENYYEYGDKVGHYRDESYLYYTQLLHETGVYSSAFVLRGRDATPTDVQLASGNDVYESSVPSCTTISPLKKFQVENTASSFVRTDGEFSIGCEGREYGYGQLAYNESTDTYPDEERFGRYRGKPIQLFKFPDEAKAPRYSVIEGKNYINILGIRFYNITAPLKEDGTIDTQWKGYRIIRVDRRGNKTVISRGILTNVRSFHDNITDKDVFYSNYPYNDLSPDQLLSETQTTFKNNQEEDYTAPSKFYLNKFNFYSPHNYIGKYALGDEIKIETEEVAEVEGNFQPVYKHPKGRLLSLFSFWLAAAMGGAQALLTTIGKNTYKSSSESDLTITAGVRFDIQKEYKLETVDDLIGLDVIGLTTDAIKALDPTKVADIIKIAVLTIAALGLKALAFTFIGIQYANIIIDAIEKFLGFTEYAYQYNSHGLFNKQYSVKNGFKRRHVDEYRYLGRGIISLKDGLYQNSGSSNSVYVELNQDIAQFTNTDTTRKSATGFGVCDNITQKIVSQAVTYYSTSRRNLPNQYGRIESNTNFIITHNNFNTFETTSPIIFGGDCFINRFSVQNKHQFFTQNLSNFNYPDGAEFDYRQYRNIAYPRFWMNSFKYDFSELISKDVTNFSTFSRTVASRHNLDCKGNDDENVFRVDDAYFYTSYNGVMEFFVESDFNLSLREVDELYPHYSDKFSSLTEIFRSDRIDRDEIFKYDQSFSKQATEIFAQPQLKNALSVQQYDKNRLVYSLPAYQEQQYDNWLYFLSNNSYLFPIGNFISLHRVDDERILFLFDRSSPYITMGTNQLQLKDGTEIQIGSGGLFAQPPKGIIYTENAYGNAQNRSAVTCHFGTFFPSERQGRFFGFDSSLSEISRNGINKWGSFFLPVKLITLFPEFKDKDNTLIGVGFTTSFDPNSEMIYFSKKDYYPKDEYINDITYNSTTNQFYYTDIPISLTNDRFFEDLSLTISYFPALKGFVGFHDWNPDSSILGEKSLFTIKENGIWQHSKDCQNYCNYYGKQYPFEIEYVISNEFQVKTLSSLEYYLECYKYLPDCINRTHLLNENFSHAIISNSEQTSGLLKLNLSPTNPYDRYLFPKKLENNMGYDILFSKKENKYRIDQFSDVTNDRNSDTHLFFHSKNGWTKTINPKAINIDKHPYERKLFRHYDIKIALIKEIPISRMIMKLSLAKQINSDR